MKLEPLGILASHFLPWMTGIQARSLVLLALTGIALFCVRRSSAAMRHLVLSLTVLSLLALPLLSLFLPSWSVPPLPHSMVVLPQGASSAPQATSAGARKTVDTAPDVPRSIAVPAVASPTTQSQSPNYQSAAARSNRKSPAGLPSLSQVLPIIAVLVFLIWVLGVALLLLRLVLGLLRLHQMARRTEPTTTVAPILTEELSALSLSLRLWQSVRLLVGTPETPGLSPMTWGLWRPVVLLPAESNVWSLSCLRPVLLHELAHVQRGDWGTELLARVVCALYWPNPLVWLLVRRLQSESECACDDRVILAGIAPADYAHHLVEVARGLKGQREQIHAPAAVMMAHSSRVADRVRAILSGHHSRRPATVRVGALALVGVVSVILPLASLRVASAGDQETTSLQIGEMTFYNGALPWARLLLAQMKSKMTLEEYRTLAATRLAPGSDGFPSGVVAEGLYVSGIQPDGSIASWDRTGNLLARGPNWRGSRLKTGELRFQIDRLKLPGMPEWLDKTTLDRLTNTRTIESEFGVVGEPAGYFGKPGAAIDGNGYCNFIESCVWKPRRAAATVDLYLTISYGTWQTLGENRQKQSTPTLIPDNSITLSPLVTRRGGIEAEVVVSLPARFLSRDSNGRSLWCLRLEPVDAVGNAVGKPRIAQYNETPAGSSVSHLRFRFLTSELPFAKVVSVRLLARPLQTLYFRNVPTKPVGIPGVPTVNH